MISSAVGLVLLLLADCSLMRTADRDDSFLGETIGRQRVPGMRETSCRERAARKFKNRYEALLEDLMIHGATADNGADATFVHPLVEDVGVYDCCAMNPETGHCLEKRAVTDASWKECLCVGYLKIKGGMSAFNAAAEDAKN